MVQVHFKEISNDQKSAHIHRCSYPQPPTTTANPINFQTTTRTTMWIQDVLSANRRSNKKKCYNKSIGTAKHKSWQHHQRRTCIFHTQCLVEWITITGALQKCQMQNVEQNILQKCKNCSTIIRTQKSRLLVNNYNTSSKTQHFCEVTQCITPVQLFLPWITYLQKTCQGSNCSSSF